MPNWFPHNPVLMTIPINLVEEPSNESGAHSARCCTNTGHKDISKTLRTRNKSKGGCKKVLVNRKKNGSWLWPGGWDTSVASVKLLWA